MRKRAEKQRAFVFITAIIMTTVLMVAVWEFTYVVSQNMRLSYNLVKELQALSIARAAFRGGLAVLKADDPNEDGLHDTWRKLLPPFLPLGIGTAKLEITAEDAKLNINQMVNDYDNYNSVNTTIFSNVQGVFEMLGYDPNLVYGVVDFIDSNSLSSSFGAEKDYYESLNPPVTIKNGPLDSLTELLQVKDISLEMFYGPDEKNNKNIDSKDEIVDVEKGFEIKKGLIHYLTVFGDYSTSSSGSATNFTSLNINFVPLALIKAISDDVTDLTLERIEETRQKSNIIEADISNKDFMMSNYVISSETYDYLFLEKEGVRRLGVKSKFFHIVGTGEVDNVTKRVEAVVKRENKRFSILHYSEI